MLADDVKNYIFAVDCQFVNEAKPIPPDSLLEDFFLIKKLPPRWYAQECRFGVLSWAFGAHESVANYLFPPLDERKKMFPLRSHDSPRLSPTDSPRMAHKQRRK